MAIPQGKIPRFDEWQSLPPDPTQLAAAESGVAVAKGKMQQAHSALDAAKPPRFDQWAAPKTPPRFDAWTTKQAVPQQPTPPAGIAPAVDLPDDVVRSVTSAPKVAATLPVRPAPVPFKPGVGQQETQRVPGIQGLASAKYQAPESHQLGEAVTAKLPEGQGGSDDALANAALTKLGPDYAKLNEAYRAATGRNMVDVHGAAVNRDGTFTFQPSKHTIDFINAFAAGHAEGGVQEGLKRAAQVNQDALLAWQLAEQEATQGASGQVQQAENLKAAANRAGTDKMTDRDQLQFLERGVIGNSAPLAQAIGTVADLDSSGSGQALKDYSNTLQAAAEQGDIENPATTFGQHVAQGIGQLIPTALEFGATGPLGVAQLPILGALHGKTAEERIKGVAEGAATQGVLGAAPKILGALGPTAQKAVTGAAIMAPPVVQSIAAGQNPTQAIVGNLPFAALPFLHGKGTEKVPTVPEKPVTIAAQMEALGKGTRDAVLVTPGAQRPAMIPGVRVEKTAEGIFYYDPKKLDRVTIQQKVADGTFGELIGHVASKPAPGEPTGVVVARDAKGEEVQSSAVPLEAVPAQAAAIAAQHPDAAITTGGPELAQQVVGERLEGPTHHSQLQPRTETGQFDGPPVERRTTPRTTIDDLKTWRESITQTPDGYQVKYRDQPAELAATPEEALAKVRQQANASVHLPELNNPNEPNAEVEAQATRDVVNKAKGDNVLQNKVSPATEPTPAETPLSPSPASATPKDTVESVAGAGSYLGEQLKKDGSVAYHMFNDPQTGSTLTLSGEVTPESVQAKMDASRAKFAGAKKPPTAESVPPVADALPPPKPNEPAFVTAARERLAKRQADEAAGIRYKHSGGPDTQPIIDNLLVHGYDFYSQKVKPTFEAWSKKLRDQFGPESDEHLAGVWKQLGGTDDATTSIKNAAVESKRELMDLPELTPAQHQSWAEAGEKARAQGLHLPDKADALADAVNNGTKKGLTAEESAGLRDRIRDVENQHETLLDIIWKEKDPEKVRELRAERDLLKAKFESLTDASKKGGSDVARALAIRNSAINRTYSLVSMEREYKAVTGKDPSPEVSKTIENLHRQIKEQQAKLTEHEQRVANEQVSRATEKIRRDVARETRQVQRGLKKADLDNEAKQLKQLIAAAWKKVGGSNIHGMAAVDPEAELSKLILKLARNRLKANIQLKGEQLLDEVHGILTDVADIDKRRVAEIIAGYGKPRKPQSPEQQRMNALKSELYRGLAAEDVAAGKRSARSEGPRLSEGIGKKEGPQLGPKQGPPDSWPARKRMIERQIAELERRGNAQEFGPKPKKPPTVNASLESQRMAENLQRAKLNYERKLRQWESDHRSAPEKAADLLVKWGRAAKLSYVSTLGKLGSAAVGRTVMSPIENLVGEVPHLLMPQLSAKATTEGGGFSKAAEVAALWKGNKLRQTLNMLLSGASDLDLRYGPNAKMLDKEMSGDGILGVPGRIHGAMKEMPRQMEFNRAFVKVLKNYEKAGQDVTQPSTQLAARMEAFNAAERARFQQHNVVSDSFNSAMRSLEQKGLAGRAASKAGQFLFPIVRVPVNVAGETLNYSFGLPRAVIETAIRGGVKNLTPEQANNIMRAYKKGGVGLAVMVYAFAHPQQFGGYYQKNDKRDANQPKAGEIMFFGKRIPKALTHVPILEAAQMAATARRVWDKLNEKGESKQDAAVGGAGAAIKGVAEGVPFYETPARYFGGKEGSQGTAQLLGEQTRGMIPGFVQEYAKARDTGPTGQPVPRRPSGSFAQRFGQTVASGVPVARESVPISGVFGNTPTKASDEIQRLQIPLQGAVRKADETPEQFEQRAATENPQIRQQLAAVVDLPEYDAATDADKVEWLKQAVAKARADAKDQLPEKPEKKETREFQMPVPRGLGHKPQPFKRVGARP